MHVALKQTFKTCQLGRKVWHCTCLSRALVLKLSYQCVSSLCDWDCCHQNHYVPHGIPHTSSPSSQHMLLNSAASRLAHASDLSCQSPCSAMHRWMSVGTGTAVSAAAAAVYHCTSLEALYHSMHITLRWGSQRHKLWLILWHWVIIAIDCGCVYHAAFSVLWRSYCGNHTACHARPCSCLQFLSTEHG